MVGHDTEEAADLDVIRDGRAQYRPEVRPRTPAVGPLGARGPLADGGGDHHEAAVGSDRAVRAGRRTCFPHPGPGGPVMEGHHDGGVRPGGRPR